MPWNRKTLSTSPRNIRRRELAAAKREIERGRRHAEMVACDKRTMEEWDKSGRRAARGFLFLDTIETTPMRGHTMKEDGSGLEP